MKTDSHLNDIFISERLKNKLKEIENHKITTITAPLGYGKTTAIKQFSKYYKYYHKESIFITVEIINDSADEFWARLCRLTQKKNPELSEKMESLGCPHDLRTVSLMLEILEDEFNKLQEDIFVIIDDVYLLEYELLTNILMLLANFMPDNVHIILMSRKHIFSEVERMEMGRNLCEINANDLHLTQNEIVQYAKNCGISISDKEVRKLSHQSEGWISFIYLIFRLYVHTGKWHFDTDDIYKLIEQIMIDPLSPRQKQFLIMCSMTDSFTLEMARYVWQDDDAEDILKQLNDDNAFISVDEEGVYRYHNMLLTHARRYFDKISDPDKKIMWERLGGWYFNNEEYIQAMINFYKAKSWKKLMKAVSEDNGNSLTAEYSTLVDSWCRECPPCILKENPKVIIISALEYFSVGNIPEMIKMNKFLMQTLEENSALSEEEKNNLRGESQILMGFLAFNNIEEMSIYHRRASMLMTRKSILVNQHSPWTFGSPSVLMMYHSRSGNLDKENNYMRECMPYYYKLTNGHGMGAEYTMAAETCLMRYELKNASVLYHTAARDSLGNEQFSIWIDNEFTAMRMELISGNYTQMFNRLKNIKNVLTENRLYFIYETVDMFESWIYSILNQPSNIAEWIVEENEENVRNIYYPVFLTFRNQALLAKKEYEIILSRADEMKSICDESGMVLCKIYVNIQLAAAYLNLGMNKRAYKELESAVKLAAPDKIILPFMENFRYIYSAFDFIFPDGLYRDFIEKIQDSAVDSEILSQKAVPDNLADIASYGLSKRELDVASLAAKRRTTKEISEILVLSEHTVKNHLTHVFEKMNLKGSSKCKRSLLEKIFKESEE